MDVGSHDIALHTMNMMGGSATKLIAMDNRLSKQLKYKIFDS